MSQQILEPLWQPAADAPPGPHAFQPERFAPIQRAINELAPRIHEQVERAEQQRHMDIDVARAIAAAGLHRLAAPADVGGDEAHPFLQILSIEALARVDGSAGWNLMIGLEVQGFLHAALDASLARMLLDNPQLVVSGALNPLGRATPVAGGYRVTGQWPMASGCHASHYFWGQCMEEPPRRPAELLEVLVPREEFEILDTWKVSGLRASGSHDVRVEGLFVPHERITRVNRGLRPRTPLFRLPTMSRLAYNKVGVATGIARAAVDHFTDLAMNKTPRFSRTPLATRVDAQQAITKAEVLLQSARAFVFQAVGDLWRLSCTGQPIDLRTRALVQLACSHAAQAAVDSVDTLAAVTGITSNFLTSPLERCQRDVRVVRQHVSTSSQWLPAVGKVLLQQPSESFVL